MSWILNRLDSILLGTLVNCYQSASCLCHSSSLVFVANNGSSDMLSHFVHSKIDGNQWGAHGILRFHTSIAQTNVLVHKILQFN